MKRVASHVPSVTYHDPQMKYSRSIMKLRRILREKFIGPLGVVMHR
jgi:hypothetical protein